MVGSLGKQLGDLGLEFGTICDIAAKLDTDTILFHYGQG